jgi:hypothetical protein
MGFFKKQKPTEEISGRRRPLPSNSVSQRTQAFSYYNQRSAPQANTGRGQSQDSESAGSGSRPWYLQGPVMAVGAFVVLVGLMYLLTLTSNPKIVELSSNGSNYFMQESSVYQQTAAQSLSSSLFNKNKLTVDTVKVAKDLTTEFPEIHTATVVIPLLGHQPVVYISPYRPAFILTTTDNKAYLLDENGRAEASASQITNPDDLSVPTVQDKSGLEIKLGSQALPTGTVHFVLNVVSMLNAANVKPQTLALPAASSELDAAISGKPYLVKFNLQGDAKLQAGTFLATKERLEKDHVAPAQYIDVRVPERAYYK